MAIKKSFLPAILVAVLFSVNGYSQQELSAKLNVKAAMVVPAFYGFDIISQRYKGGGDCTAVVSPDFKPSYLIGLQLKTRKNLLVDLQFQYYEFRYKGGVYYSRTHYKIGPNQAYGYYSIVDYGQYRVSVGLGKLIELDEENSLGFTGGLVLLMGDQKQTHYDMYTVRNVFIGSVSSGNSYGWMAGTYINSTYNFQVSPRVQVFGDLNYCFLYGYGEIYTDAGIRYRHLLAVNLGISYALVRKTWEKISENTTY